METLSPRGLVFTNTIFTGYNCYSYINTGLLYRGHSRGVKSKKGNCGDAALPRNPWGCRANSVALLSDEGEKT